MFGNSELPPKRLVKPFSEGRAMNYSSLCNWIGRKLNINKRLRQVAIAYVLFAMVSVRKHSLQEAAAFSNSSKSRFSKFLKEHPDLAIVKVDELSKRQARQFGQCLQFWRTGIPVIKSRLQGRRNSLDWLTLQHQRQRFGTNNYYQ